MILYKTVAGLGEAEQIIEKSRFITHVRPVSTREEAEDFIREIKSRYKDATHNVPAMVIGDKFQIQWGSDDGEPQGTSGAPIVQMLVKEEITNLVVVVTRYFGGIKLGTGGLVRAYTSSARLGLEAAGICTMQEMTKIRCRVDYTHLSRIQNLGESGLFTIVDTQYTDKVEITLLGECSRGGEIQESLQNLTSGGVEITSVENCVCQMPKSV